MTDPRPYDLAMETGPCGVRETIVSILQEAEELIHGDRAKEYGHPAENLGRIATLWSAYLKENITASDVATMMILLKVARLKTGVGSRDTWIDIAGYAGLLELIDEAAKSHLDDMTRT